MTGVTSGETIESDYYTFMGFDPAHARSGLSFYAPFFAGLDPVLELAPGRGEFLDVLREAGTTGRGVDLDEGMVAAAVEQGHDVVLGDAIASLASVGVDVLACTPERSEIEDAFMSLIQDPR